MNIFKKISSSSLIFKSGIASIDQAILSLLNFFISILLIKTVAKVEYGYYAYAFSISIFLITIQNAVINAPLAMLLASKKEGQKRQYCGALCYGQFLGILPAICIALTGIVLLWLWRLDGTQASIAAAVSFAAMGILYREFLRAYFFANESPIQVLRLDGLYVMLFLSLIALGYLISNISVTLIFILMGISALTVSWFCSRGLGWRYQFKSVKDSYKENWNFGRWILFGVIVTHVQQYSYLYLLGALIGSEMVAEVAASKVLMAPLLLAMIGWRKIAVPHGSKLREQQQLNLFFKELIVTGLIFLLIAGVYVTVILTFSGVLLRYLLTDSYANSINYILIWGVAFAVRFFGQNASNGLMVTKNVHIIAKTNFVTMLITIGCAFFLIQSHGIKGGLSALIIGELLLTLALWFYLTRVIYSRSERRPSTEIKKEVAFKLSRKDSGTV